MRPIDKVLEDVRNEKVGLQTAPLIYGVVIDALTQKLDEAATRELRSKPPAQLLPRFRGSESTGV